MQTNTVKKNIVKTRKKAKIIHFPKKKKITKDIFTLLSSTPALILLVLILMTVTINLRVQIYETKIKIDKAEKEIAQLSAENTVLNTRFENMFSYKELQKKAEEIGMQKRSKSQIHYISTPLEDYAEIVEKGD